MKHSILALLLLSVFFRVIVTTCNAQQLSLASNGVANYSIVTTGDGNGSNNEIAATVLVLLAHPPAPTAST